MDNSARNNPLLNDLVLQTLFAFLDEKDIKSCRLVCLKWEAISRGYFVKIAKVFIKSIGPNGSEVLDNFKEIFPDAYLIPFTKFYFNGLFPEDKFLFFINSFLRVTELFLESFNLQGHKVYSMNGCGWKKLNLKTLSCSGSNSCTKMVIPLSKVSLVQNLHLDGPFSVLIDSQISPQEVFIQGGVTFFLDGNQKQTIVHLNEFMNLKMLRKLILNQKRPTALSADVSACQHLESLSNHWGGLFGLSSHLKIKELSISTSCDLSLLPTTIEKLQLGRDHVYYTSEVSLPNLQYLQTDNGASLHKFGNCPNLTDLVIGKYYNYTLPVQIPLKVSRMYLNAKAVLFFQFLRNENYIYLDYLNLELYVESQYHSLDFQSLGKVLEMFESVRAKSVVINFRGKLHTQNLNVIYELINIVKIQSERKGTVAFGELEWDEYCHSLFEVVDRKMGFYLFRNGHGKGMEADEFKKIVML